MKYVITSAGLILAVALSPIAVANGPLSVTNAGLGRYLQDYDDLANGVTSMRVFLEPANASSGCATFSNADMVTFVTDILDELASEAATLGSDLIFDIRSTGMTDNSGALVSYDVNAATYKNVYVNNGDSLSAAKVNNEQTVFIFDHDGKITADINGSDNQCKVLGFGGMVFGSNSTDPEVEKGQLVLNCASFNRSLCPSTVVTEDDIITVIKHEFMHAMGKDHSQLGRDAEETDEKTTDDRQVATMYPHLVSGIEQAILNKDDLVGLAAVYHSSTTSSFITQFGSISGAVIDKNERPMPCVEVTAENTANADDVVSAVTGYFGTVSGEGEFQEVCTRDCGTFKLEGLSGTYRMMVRNVSSLFNGADGGASSSSIGRCSPGIQYDLNNDGRITDTETVTMSPALAVGAGTSKSNVKLQVDSLVTTNTSTSGQQTEPENPDDPDDDPDTESAAQTTSVCSLYAAATPSRSEILSALFFVFTGWVVLATTRRCVIRKP